MTFSIETFLSTVCLLFRKYMYLDIQNCAWVNVFASIQFFKRCSITPGTQKKADKQLCLLTSGLQLNRTYSRNVWKLFSTRGEERYLKVLKSYFLVLLRFRCGSEKFSGYRWIAFHWVSKRQNQINPPSQSQLCIWLVERMVHFSRLITTQS